MNKIIPLITLFLVWTIPVQAKDLDDSHHKKAFPKIIAALEGAPPEGFTIGKKHMAYNGSINGSIYKMDLRTGEGEILVKAEPGFNVFAGDCYKLGMRIDRRTNYLFVAGCSNGDAYVYDADDGELIMKYQLDNSGMSVINDLVITKKAVYFTDFGQAMIYKLPLSKHGRIPENSDAAIAIPLIGDWVTSGCCSANGIVASRNGKTLIVGHSGLAKLYRVDPNTGYADEIILDHPLTGFIDGIVKFRKKLYVLTPDDSGTYPPVDHVRVVRLDKNGLTGTLMGSITDPDMDGIASGAFHGKFLYVNNARYSNFPGCETMDTCTNYWITKLNIRHFH